MARLEVVRKSIHRGILGTNGNGESALSAN
jgi:hypothetical protein